MNTKPQILDLKERHAADPRAALHGRRFPHTEHAYQSSTLLGTCGTPAKFRGPSFFEISNHYFADEAPRSFAVEAGVFAALILTAIPPMVNGAQAVAHLIHSIGVL